MRLVFDKDKAFSWALTDETEPMILIALIEHDMQYADVFWDRVMRFLTHPDEFFDGEESTWSGNSTHLTHNGDTVTIEHGYQGFDTAEVPVAALIWALNKAKVPPLTSAREVHDYEPPTGQ